MWGGRPRPQPAPWPADGGQNLHFRESGDVTLLLLNADTSGTGLYSG